MLLEVSYHNDTAQAPLLQGPRDLLRLRNTAPLLPVIHHPVIGKQHSRLDLRQAVQDGAHPAIRADPRPDGPHGRRAEHGHDGLRVVRDVARHDVARGEPSRAERIRAAADGLAEGGPRGRDVGAALGGGYEGRGGRVRRRGREEEVLGKVEARAGEEVRAREHVLGGEDLRRVQRLYSYGHGRT